MENLSSNQAVDLASIRFRNFINSSQGVCAVIENGIFEDLFVLELANNHLGSVERGLKIIQEFSQVSVSTTFEP